VNEVIGAAQAHGRPHQQRKNADGRQREIQRLAGRNRRDLDVRLLARLQPQDGVLQPLSGRGRMQHPDDVLDALDGLAVDRQQHVAALQAGAVCRRPWRDLIRNDFPARRAPQHAVFHFRPRRALNDIGDGQAQQSRDDDTRPRRSHPRAELTRSHHEYWLYPAE
jgi:hypothetical protein